MTLILVTPGKNLKSNEHLQMFYRLLEKNGYEVKPWSFAKFLSMRSGGIWHIHWTDGFYRGTLLSKGIKKYHWSLAILRFLNFLFLLFLAKLKGVKIIWSIHDVIDIESYQKHSTFLQKMTYKILIRYADRVTAYNQYIKREMTRYGNRDIIVMRRGSYEGEYPDRIDKLEAREKLNIPKDAFVFLLFGHIMPYKGVDILVRAFQQYHDDNIFLVIAGTTYRNSNYGNEIHEMVKIDKRIIFHDEYIETENVQDYFRAADYTVYPYREISHSGVLFLSITFGIPFIVSDKGGVGEFLDLAPDAGILIKDATESAVLMALKQAKEKKDVSEAINLLRQEYRWEKFEEDVLKVFNFNSLLN